MTQHAWMVRAGDNNELVQPAEQKGAVAIGWQHMGDPSELKTREEFKRRYAESSPGTSAPTINLATGEIYRF